MSRRKRKFPATSKIPTYEPTREEIRAVCLEIQEDWDDRIRESRQSYTARDVVPVVRDPNLNNASLMRGARAKNA